ncbi:hypothetical protein ETB97_000641 [Aspergillus alliaceus]|uniref:Uncharacterized protein n=1 Tax=Petromyces alliaceus TaxID=209559 RepID=A0A8H6ACT2_PETAA|nr:hypothetical protein ETB97_000641 [Aspergillus burnettii]
MSNPPIVTQAPVPLSKPSDWRLWYENTRTCASDRDVRNYINPEEENPPSRPSAPQRPKPKDIDETFSSIKDVVRSGKTAELAVNTQILATVSRKHQYCIAKQQDPRKALKTLKRRFELDIRIERPQIDSGVCKTPRGPS